MLIHTVFFWLRPDLTDAQRAAFWRGVDSLRAIGGIERAWVGAPAGTPARPVVDKSFSAGLTVICTDKAAHDAYQEDPIHLAFVANCGSLWTRVQVYDVETGAPASGNDRR